MWDDEVFTTAEPIRSVSGLWQIWFSPSDIPSDRAEFSRLFSAGPGASGVYILRRRIAIEE